MQKSLLLQLILLLLLKNGGDKDWLHHNFNEVCLYICINLYHVDSFFFFFILNKQQTCTSATSYVMDRSHSAFYSYCPPPLLSFQGLMHGPPVSQLPHHDPLSSHQPMHHHQQHHRQDLPHHQQQQLNLSEPRPMMHHSQNPFHQQQPHGSPRLMTPRPPNPQQRNMSNRQRMVRD